MKKTELEKGDLVTACGFAASLTRKIGILVKLKVDNDGWNEVYCDVYWVGEYPRLEGVSLSYLRKIT